MYSQTIEHPPTDRVDTETLDAALAIVCQQMRWDDDLPAGAYFTGFGEFDPEL